MAYTRDELLEMGMLPEQVDIYERIQNQPSSSSWNDILNKILYTLSPIVSEKTAEGTMYKPGPIPQGLWRYLGDLGNALTYLPFPTSPRYTIPLANAIKDVISRMDITPQGLLVKEPQTKQRQMWPSESRFKDRWPRLTSPATPTTSVKWPSKPVDDDRSHLGPVGWGLSSQEQPAEEPDVGTIPLSTPPVSPEPQAPSTAETAPGQAVEPDFTELMEPRERIDVEKELMKIFNEVIPKWEDLPQPEYKEPKTLPEYVTTFLQNLALAASGKDPLEYRRLKKAEAESEASLKRNYAIQRATNLLQLRLQGLQDRLKKEDEEFVKQGKWLEFLDKATDGRIWSNPNAVAMVANMYNIPPSRVNTFLNSMRDPKTGRLVGMGMTSTDRQLDLIRKSQEITADLYRRAGIPESQIPFAIASGTLNAEQFLITMRDKAIMEGNMELANKYTEQLEIITRAKTVDPKRSVALDMLNKINEGKLDMGKLFGGKEVGNLVTQALVGQAVGLSDELIKSIIQSMTKNKDVKFKDQLAIMAYDATSSPEKAAAFEARYGLKPQAWLNAYMDIKTATGGQLPQPFKLMAEQGIDVQKDPLKFIGPGVREVTKPFFDILWRKYEPLLIRPLHEGFVDPKTGQRKEFKEFKKKPITEAEFYTLVTAYENEGEEGFFKAIEQVLRERRANK